MRNVATRLARSLVRFGRYVPYGVTSSFARCQEIFQDTTRCANREAGGTPSQAIIGGRLSCASLHGNGRICFGTGRHQGKLAVARSIVYRESEYRLACRAETLRRTRAGVRTSQLRISARPAFGADRVWLKAGRTSGIAKTLNQMAETAQSWLTVTILFIARLRAAVAFSSDAMTGESRFGLNRDAGPEILMAAIALP